MKKRWIFWAMIGLAVAAGAEEEQMLTVTGDRVSLRAAPDLNAVLLDRAMTGDELVLQDNSNPDWVGVLPPGSIDLWVLGKYVEGGHVIPPRLNVRSGPSLSHGVVGVVTNGMLLTVRGEVAGWFRIAPPQGTKVWISRRFVDGVEAPSAGSVRLTIKTKAPETTVKTVTQSADGNVVVESVTTEPPDSDRLVPDPDKQQGRSMEFRGVLRAASGKLYKLVDPDTGRSVICFVRGNQEQMKRLDGETVTVIGPTYWAKGMTTPVVRPDTIELPRPEVEEAPRRGGRLRQPDQSRL